jgi:hypothetical protein
MNELPKGFEDLPIGFVQALFEFYRVMEGNNPTYDIGEISIKNIDPSMRSAIIRGDYVAIDLPKQKVIKQKVIKPIRNSEIYNFGEKLGLDRNKILNIIKENRNG